MNIYNELESNINYMSKQMYIKNECYEDLMNLVVEMSKHCPHNIVDHATRELWRISDKFCEIKQYQMQ